MKPNRFLLLAFALSLALPLWAARPAGPVKGKKAEKTEATAPAPKKSPYEKFLAKKNLKRSEGGPFRLYLDGKKILAEIPDSLMGRKLLISTSLRQSSSPLFLAGDNVSPQRVFVLHRTDSLLLLTHASPLSVLADTTLAAAIARSSIRPTAYAFPLQYRNGDSTAFVVNVSKLFEPTNKDVFDVKGVSIDERASVNTATPKGELTRFDGFVHFGASVGIRQEITLSVSQSTSLGGGLALVSSVEDAVFTGTFQTTLTLLSDEQVPIRKADPHVGVQQTPFATYRSDKAFRSDGAALRWDVRDGKKITVYVDTLFSPSWQEAIRKGILSWNPAFEAIGLGRVIDVRPYPSYGRFSVDDPLVSTVRAGRAKGGERLRGSMVTDISAGRILSCTIVVPSGYADGAGEKGRMGISDVDARYATYYPSDEAVCEVLRAEMMKLFGRMLGLKANMAGSSAFTPAQLRSADFTRVNGLTASVTDNVLFNSLARPGDRQKGVVTIVNQIGPYDRFAIDWLYRIFPQGTDETEALARLVREKALRREYLYVPQIQGYPDYRGLSGDLGSDPLASYEASMARLRFIAREGASWLQGVNPEEDGYPVIFPERIWLQALSAQNTLMNQVGGMAFLDLEGGRKYLPQKESVQRACLERVLGAVDDFDWLEQSPLNRMASANTDYAAYSRSNIVAPMSRIAAVAMAEKLGASSFTVRNYLDRLTDAFTAPIRAGKLAPGAETQLSRYIAMLAGFHPVLKTRIREHFHQSSLSGEEAAFEASLQVPYAGVPAWCLEDLPEEGYLQLERLRKVLSAGKTAARSEVDRGRIAYLLGKVEAALEPDKK